MVRFKTTPRRGTSSHPGFHRLISRAPATREPSVSSSSDDEIRREVIVISDDDEIHAPTSPLSSIEARLTSIKQRLSDLRREVHAWTTKVEACMNSVNRLKDI